MNIQNNDLKLLFFPVPNLWLSMTEVNVKRSTYDKYTYLIVKYRLTQRQMADLFQLSRTNIVELIQHIHNMGGT